MFCYSRINCTVELLKSDKYQWGEIFDNRTGNGVLGKVVEDQADVGISEYISICRGNLFLTLIHTIVNLMSILI